MATITEKKRNGKVVVFKFFHCVGRDENSDFSTTVQREKAYSLSYLGFNLGCIVGAGLAGVLFTTHLRLAFCINALAIFTSTLLIFFFVHAKNAISKDMDNLLESYSEYEYPVDENIPVLTILRQRPVLIGMLLVSCFASLPSNIVGILLPLQLKEAMGAAGATIYGYLNSLNGFVVITFTPILTIALKKITEIPKSIMGLLFFIAGISFFSTGVVVSVLFFGMFVFTLGEVITVLGHKPYNSRRIPASHRGRVGGVDKEFLGLDADGKICGGGHETMCNPIAQAEVLNSEKTEFNIIMGLCVGHDSLFMKHSDAMCTVFAVKDRLMGHNPLASLYTSDTYYKYIK